MSAVGIETKFNTGPGHVAVLSKLSELYSEAISHEGFAEIRIDVKILRKGQKEVILHCGKQYRFIVDYPTATTE